MDAINAYAQTLKDTDVFQEGTKGTRKEITSETIQIFNEIYGTVSSIAIIAAKFFKTDAAKKDQFSFAKVSKTLNKTTPIKKP